MIRKRVLAGIIPFTVMVFVFIGCSLNSSAGKLDPLEIAEIASLTLDYQSRQLEGEKAAMEVDDVNNDSNPSMSFHASVFGVDSEPDYILDDGSEVYVSRETMDNDTPDNMEDDWIVITRSFYYDMDGDGTDASDLENTEVITRRPKPGNDWSVWEDQSVLNEDGSFSQEGSVTRYLGDTEAPSLTGSVCVTWEKTDTVLLVSIVKETISLMTMTTTITTITFDDDDNPVKELLRIRISDGNEIVVHSFLYSQYEDDGFQKTKIIRDDGACSVRWRDAGYIDPAGNETYAWFQESFDVNGILKRTKIETGSRTQRSILINIYDETGMEIVHTRSLNVRFRGNSDGSIDVIKTFDNGRVLTLGITESDTGYTIEKDGITYSVTIDLKNGTVEIIDVSGTSMGIVVIGDDGSYTVESYNGESERIEI